jgi:hypothetical protein
VEFCAAQQRWHRGACPKKSFRILESKLYKMTHGLLGSSHKSPRNLSFELRYLSCLLLFLLVIGHKARLGQEQTRRQIQKDTRMYCRRCQQPKQSEILETHSRFWSNRYCTGTAALPGAFPYRVQRQGFNNLNALTSQLHNHLPTSGDFDAIFL